MQVVYEELKILFASREDLGLISFSYISLRIKGHFRYSRLSKTATWIFQQSHGDLWSSVTFWIINFLTAMCKQINQPLNVIFRRLNYP